MVSVSVTIPTAGDWPTKAELTARDAVMDALDEAGIGSCTGAGGGMGEIDFSFNVADEATARAAIDIAMQAHFPGVTYRVNVF